MPVRSAAASRTSARVRRTGPRARSVREPGYAVFQAKITPPALRPGVVARPALVKELCRKESSRAVTVVGPPGYGKTTLLAQWAAADERAVAWISIDERDNDPLVFLRHLVAAFDKVEPLDTRFFASLRTQTKSSWPVTAQRCVRAIASCSRPYLLVLDNVDLLRSSETRRIVSALVDQIPISSTVALAGRSAPKLKLAPLRAQDLLEEVGGGELALSSREAQLLLQRTNPELNEDETANLVEVCEGWPAALYLAALSLHPETPASTRPAQFAANDRYLADFLRTEYLSKLRPPDLRFLRRTSILPLLSAPLCDAVLQRDDSRQQLSKLDRFNVFLQRYEGRPDIFRVHPLLRDLLLRELAREEQQLVPTLHHRAADWLEARGELEAALVHADAAKETDRVARTIAAIAFPVSSRGRAATLEGWLERFDGASLERYPALAIHGSCHHALRGRAAEAERWLAAAERGSTRSQRNTVQPRLAVVRAALCRRGARQMLLDSNAALLRLNRGSAWHPSALLVRGCAAVLLGADDEGDALLADAATEAAALGWSEMQMVATGQRSLVARHRADHPAADQLADEAREIAARNELQTYPTYAIALAASAQAALRRGRWAEAREFLAAADRCRPALTEAVPWLSVGVRIELARCYLTIRDLEAAATLAREIAAIQALRLDLGVLDSRARELEQDLRALTAVEQNARLGLTPAELRLLPLLATHLSFRELAEELGVSRNTVKTQAISIYRKLGVSGRSDAIAAAASLDPTRRTV